MKTLVTLIGFLVVLPINLTFGQSEKEAALLKTFAKEFVAIKPGSKEHPSEFEFGEKRAKTKISQSFSIAKYEVPQNLWEFVMKSNPSRWKGERNSVELLSFDDAAAFCQKVTSMLQESELIKSDQYIRLPTEIEWEYITKAGTATKYSFGDDARQLGKYAWSTENAAGNDPPVGAKEPNPWGLYDVHGYLWEWCVDSDSPHLSKKGWEKVIAKKDGKQILKGGSWKDKAEKLTSNYRFPAPRDTKDDAVGLRCILATESKK